MKKVILILSSALLCSCGLIVDSQNNRSNTKSAQILSSNKLTTQIVSFSPSACRYENAKPMNGAKSEGTCPELFDNNESTDSKIFGWSKVNYYFEAPKHVESLSSLKLKLATTSQAFKVYIGKQDDWQRIFNQTDLVQVGREIEVPFDTSISIEDHEQIRIETLNYSNSDRISSISEVELYGISSGDPNDGNGDQSKAEDGNGIEPSVKSCALSGKKPTGQNHLGSCSEVLKDNGELTFYDYSRLYFEIKLTEPSSLTSLGLKVLSRPHSGKILISRDNAASFETAAKFSDIAPEQLRVISLDEEYSGVTDIKIEFFTYKSASKAHIGLIKIGTSESTIANGEDSEDEMSDNEGTDNNDEYESQIACADYGVPTLTVSSKSQLNDALSSANAGDRILVTSGSYLGPFLWEGLIGQPDNKIVISAAPGVILTNENVNNDRVVTIKDSRNIVFCGFEVTKGQKGVMGENVDDSIFTNLEIHNIGHEAFHLKFESSNNILSHSNIHNAGVTNPGIGEGVYIGSHHTTKYRPENVSSSGPYIDRSNDNKILFNKIGPDIRAEHIDVKQYTLRTLIEGNTFDGNGITGENYADSWVDIKGSYVVVKGNSGTGGPGNGFEVHDLLKDDSNDSAAFNQFSNNTGNVKSGSFLIYLSGKRKSTNSVSCDNSVSGGEVSNIDCE